MSIGSIPGRHITGLWDGLSRYDKRSLAGMYGTVIMLHVVGLGALFGIVAPQHFPLGGPHPVFTGGVGVLAYTFGLRHAFDADHIAAVDNTTRKLLADNIEGQAGRNPFSVGFWFSLGHSTVVFGLSVAVAVAARELVGLQTDSSPMSELATVLGPAVSGLFLWIIGIANLVVVIGVCKVLRALRRGHYVEAELERQLQSRGFMNRFLGSLTKSVTKPWHIYPIGVLFGLGFDTATEVALLVLAGGAAAYSLPFYAVVVLPILFAAGMALADTTDGVFMTYAYRWAYAEPARKIYYNLITTALSVAVALIVGTIELAGVLAERLRISSGPLAAIASLGFDYAGYVIVGVFIVAWLVSIVIWKLARVEHRWSSTSSGQRDVLSEPADFDISTT